MSLVNWFDPITRKRLQRFREYKRAWYSLLIIVIPVLDEPGRRGAMQRPSAIRMV